MNTDPALDAPPQALADLINAFARFVTQSVGVAPDLTNDTLPLADHYLSEVRAESTVEVRELVIESGGAYFGEVLRRHLNDGAWIEDGDSWRLQFQRCSLALRPADLVSEALSHAQRAPLDMAARDRPIAEQAVQRLGDVATDDYFRLAVRLEVIEAIHGALTAAELQRKSLN
ncbi:MAG: hypothetical protein AAGF12_22925 [Myxococcota bacterium]